MNPNLNRWWFKSCVSDTKSIAQTTESAVDIALGRRCRDVKISVNGSTMSCTAIVGSHTKITSYYHCSFELDMSASPVVLTKHACACAYK
jgi:phage gp36-like protein